MPRTRPPYPEQFRREAIELAKKSGRPISEIAKDLGVTEQSLRNWIEPGIPGSIHYLDFRIMWIAVAVPVGCPVC
jgi:hypothetical protein